MKIIGKKIKKNYYDIKLHHAKVVFVENKKYKKYNL